MPIRSTASSPIRFTSSPERRRRSKNLAASPWQPRALAAIHSEISDTGADPNTRYLLQPMVTGAFGGQLDCIDLARSGRCFRRPSSASCCPRTAGCCRRDGPGHLVMAEPVLLAGSSNFARRPIASEIQEQKNRPTISPWLSRDNPCASTSSYSAATQAVNRCVAFETWKSKLFIKKNQEQHQAMWTKSVA